MTVSIVARPHPVRQEAFHADVPAGQTLQQMLGDAAPTIHAWVGDAYVPRELWARVRPKAGAVVNVRAVAHGGDDVLRTVLTIAVLAAGIYAPTAFGVTSKFGIALLTAGVGVVGQLAVNALVPPQLPSLSKPLNSLSGTQNQVSPFGPVPCVYGRTRLYPPYGAKPYTEVVGNDQYLRALFCLGYGPMTVTEIKVGETPIEQFDGIEYEVSNNPTYFSTLVSEESLSIQMDANGDQANRATSLGTREVSVDMVFPIGIRYVQDDGDKDPARVRFDIEYRVVGGVTWLNAKDASGLQTSGPVRVVSSTFSFSGKTAHAIRASVRWAVAAGQYEIRITRRFTESRLGDADVWIPRSAGHVKAFWSVLRSVGDLDPTPRDDLVYLSMRLRASGQLNGAVDTLNCIVHRHLPVWDGAMFVEQATQNPAWAYLDVLTGVANERPVGTARVNLDAVKAWADECDAEGRTYNADVASVYGRITVFELLRDIAAAGRASYGMEADLFSVVRDIDGAAPVQVFTPANSWGFSGSRQFVQQPHALRVRFSNETAGWQRDEVVVYADGYSQENATRYEALELRGITNPDHAWSEGRYHMAVARHRQEQYEIYSDIEAAFICRRGDVVRVAHDVIRSGLAWGRIKAVAGRDVTVDQPVTMEAGKIYGLRLRKADGSQVVKTIITQAGEQQTVTLLTEEPGLAAGDLFVFGLSGTESLVCKVLRVEPTTDQNAKLLLAPEAPEVQVADVGDIPQHEGPESVDPRAPRAPRIYFHATDETVLIAASDGGLTSRAVVYYGFLSNNRPVPATVEGQFRRVPDEGGVGLWSSVPVVEASAGEVSFLPVDDGEVYDFRLRAIAADGTPSEWTLLPGITVIGKTTPPPDVQRLFVNGDVLTWVYPSPPRDLRGFLVRYQAGKNPQWDNAIPAHPGVIAGPPFTLDDMPAGNLTVLVKAVDTSGIESVSPAVVLFDFGDAHVENIVFRDDYAAAGYPGTISNATVSGTDLLADSLSMLWTGANGAALWSANNNSLLWTGTYSAMSYETSFTPAPDATGVDSTLTLAPTVEGTAWSLQYRTHGQGPLWSGYDDNTLWVSDSAPLWEDDDGAWRAWPGQLTNIQREQFDFLLSVEGGTVRGAVYDFEFVLDVPDIIETLNDFALLAAGSRLPLTQSYRAIRNVAVIIQDDGGAATAVKRLDLLNTGPLLRAYNAAGTPVAATIDARIQGY